MLDYFIQSPWNVLPMLASKKENKEPCFPSASLRMLPRMEAVFSLWGDCGVSLTQRHRRTSVKSIYWYVFAHLEKQTAKWILNNEMVFFPFFFYFVQILKDPIFQTEWHPQQSYWTSRRLHWVGINQQRVCPAVFTFWLKSTKSTESLLFFQVLRLNPTW